MTNTKSPSLHWAWMLPNTKDQGKPENRNTSGPLIPNNARHDANASTISTHGVAKDSAFALANAQQEHTIAFHADKPGEEKWRDAHLSVVGGSVVVESGPDFLLCPSWVVGFGLVDWFWCVCFTHTFCLPRSSFLSSFPEVVCGVVGTF